MILGGLVKLLVGLVLAVLALFPAWEPPTSSVGFSALSAANIVLPLDVWATLSGATIAAMGAAFTVWAALKTINLIRGSG